MDSETILLSVNPFIKGHISTEYGYVLFGRMWNKSETELVTKQLSDRQVDFIWNLFDSSHGDVGTSKEIFTPIEDFSTPEKESFEKDLDFIITAIKNGKRVFVHCFAGKGRTSLGLASILVRMGVDKEEALMTVYEAAHGPETEAQKNFVKSLDSY